MPRIGHADRRAQGARTSGADARRAAPVGRPRPEVFRTDLRRTSGRRRSRVRWMRSMRTSSQRMTGSVRLSLFHGHATVNGSRSPFALYDEGLATYGAGDEKRSNMTPRPASSRSSASRSLPAPKRWAERPSRARRGTSPAQLQWGGPLQRGSARPAAARVRLPSLARRSRSSHAFDVRCSRAPRRRAQRAGRSIISDAGSREGASSALSTRSHARSTPASSSILPGPERSRTSTARSMPGCAPSARRGRDRRRRSTRDARRERSGSDHPPALRARPGRARRRNALDRASRAASSSPPTQTLAAQTHLAATTHWQPAQPVLLAFWLHAAE